VGEEENMNVNTVFGEFAKLRKAVISCSRLSVRPHGITLLQLKGFSLNSMFQRFSKICPENSSVVASGQE
jgi:hypothetical protein